MFTVKSTLMRAVLARRNCLRLDQQRDHFNQRTSNCRRNEKYQKHGKWSILIRITEECGEDSISFYRMHKRRCLGIIRQWAAWNSLAFSDNKLVAHGYGLKR